MISSRSRPCVGSDRRTIQTHFNEAIALAGSLKIDLRLPHVGAPRHRAAPPSGKRCDWPWRSAYITYDGTAMPCCMIGLPERINFGSVADGGFLSIWNGEEYRRVPVPASTPMILPMSAAPVPCTRELSEETMARDVAVLLPTCDRLQSLIFTLSGLAAQTLSRFHLIVADQSREPAGEEPVVRSLRRILEARGATVEWHTAAAGPRNRRAARFSADAGLGRHGSVPRRRRVHGTLGACAARRRR